MTGPSMTFLMYCVDLKDHILKVLWHYLYHWLKFKCLKNITKGDIQTDKHKFRQTEEKYICRLLSCQRHIDDLGLCINYFYKINEKSQNIRANFGLC